MNAYAYNCEIVQRTYNNNYTKLILNAKKLIFREALSLTP